MTKRLGQQAIVIGGSMAGLMTARVLEQLRKQATFHVMRDT